jgi:hypothetical protein
MPNVKPLILRQSMSLVPAVSVVGSSGFKRPIEGSECLLGSGGRKQARWNRVWRLLPEEGIYLAS